jgi:hypothetical protein
MTPAGVPQDPRDGSGWETGCPDGSDGSEPGTETVKLSLHFLHRTRADFHPENRDGSIRYAVLQLGHSRIR